MPEFIPQLKKVRLKGFRSIREATLELRPLNVLIGANGAGKSNLIAFFKLVNELMGGRLQRFIAATGRATANLHFGPKETESLEAEMTFEVANGSDVYRMKLAHAAGDSLIFVEETLSFHETNRPSPKVVTLEPAGNQETHIGEEAEKDEPTAKTLRHLLNRCRVYHFHDTSPSSKIRGYCYVGNNRFLMPDASNLAAVLYELKSRQEPMYRRIVDTVRQVAPFFKDFDLEPTTSKDIILNWRHNESDLVFGPHQLSDGTLRAICLISLLLQPRGEKLPYLIVVDEPELGLHPYALNVIASLFRAVSAHAQVLIGTQSSAFLDGFEPEDVVVVELKEGATEFSRPPVDKLDAWLEDYSLGELWEKNIIGGSPH